jgi:hypothetical protein
LLNNESTQLHNLLTILAITANASAIDIIRSNTIPEFLGGVVLLRNKCRTPEDGFQTMGRTSYLSGVACRRDASVLVLVLVLALVPPAVLVLWYY